MDTPWDFKRLIQTIKLLCFMNFNQILKKRTADIVVKINNFLSFVYKKYKINKIKKNYLFD